MSRVYIVSHGNTFDQRDVILRVGGRTDIPLSISGIDQAKALKTHLSDISFAQIFSSDLKRTRQTTEIITNNVNYTRLDMLSEVDYGPDEGKPEQDVIERIGQSALEKWNNHAIPPQGWLVEPDQIRADWVAFLARLPRMQNILVVTSNGTARFLLDVVKNGGEAERKLRTGSYGIIALSDTGPELEGWNIRP